jgi:hypothetical protein
LDVCGWDRYGIEHVGYLCRCQWPVNTQKQWLLRESTDVRMYSRTVVVRDYGRRPVFKDCDCL